MAYLLQIQGILFIVDVTSAVTVVPGGQQLEVHLGKDQTAVSYKDSQQD